MSMLGTSVHLVLLGVLRDNELLSRIPIISYMKKHLSAQLLNITMSYGDLLTHLTIKNLKECSVKQPE